MIACLEGWPDPVQREFWYFENPAMNHDTDDDALRRFRDARDQIDATIQRWVAETLHLNASARPDGLNAQLALGGALSKYV